MKAYLSLFAAAGLLAGCGSHMQTASAPTGEGRACFRPNEVASWSDGSANTLNIRTERNEVFQGQMIPACFDVDFSQQLAIQPRLGLMVCAGGDADVMIPRSISGGLERCRLDNIRRLAAEEVAALPAVDRP